MIFFVFWYGVVFYLLSISVTQSFATILSCLYTVEIHPLCSTQIYYVAIKGDSEQWRNKMNLSFITPSVLHHVRTKQQVNIYTFNVISLSSTVYILFKSLDRYLAVYIFAWTWNRWSPFKHRNTENNVDTLIYWDKSSTVNAVLSIYMLLWKDTNETTGLEESITGVDTSLRWSFIGVEISRQ